MDPTETLAINTVRCLAADTVQKAASGHPGAPMGCAPMAHVLFGRVMNYNPANPKWINRDRFVLSNGHACALQYSMLHLTGYPVSMDDLKAFRQLSSITPGHPEVGVTAGVEVSTGPLGQGISNAVGIAIAEQHLGALYNRGDHTLIDHYTYVICGDGCLQEGVSSEASSLAGHLGLGKLIVLYDDNKITIDGPTDLSFTEDVLMRYEAYGWHTQSVEDGNNDVAGIQAAIEAAKAVADKPSIIKVSTLIGFGSAKAGSEKTHGAPLGADDIVGVKTRFGFDPEKSFYVPDEVYAFYKGAADRGAATEAAWASAFEAYSAAEPALAAEFTRRVNGDMPEGWKATMPTPAPTDKSKATREHSEASINALAAAFPELVGGSADLTPSNKTLIKTSHDFQRGSRDGRYFRFGVREHAMAAICNGMAAYGGMIPYCATFLNFCGYALGAVRLSALSHLRVLYVFTHDSIGLGEDGPTHQPIGMLWTLRSMPNMYTFRPADGVETSGCYAAAMELKHAPSAHALSRSGVPNLPTSSIEKCALGAYTVHQTGGAAGASESKDTEFDSDGLQLVIAATGSEVGFSIAAADALAGKKVRVVSMPCLELYDAQSAEYKASVFPEGVPIMSVEAASICGWEKYAHVHIGMTEFGASAKGADAYKHFGFTPDQIAAKAAKVIDFYAANPVPSLSRPTF